MAVTSSGPGNFSSVITGGLSVNDDVIINHDVTLDGPAPNVNSLVINSGKTLTGGGNKITLDGENGSGFVITNDGSISGNLDLEINTTSPTSINIGGSAGNCFRDLKLNDANVDLHLHTDTFIDGNLTIAAGQLTCATEAGAAKNLEVIGNVSLTGTLTGNASAVTLGSLTINSAGTYSATSGTTTLTSEGTFWALDVVQGGTFTHNNGTVTVTTNTNTLIRGMEGDDTSGTGANALNNLIVNLGSDSYRLEMDYLASDDSCVIAGDLTITRGKFYPRSTDDDGNSFTVEGDVLVSADGLYGVASRTGADSFGSVTIASGGEFIATSGTTTITNETSSHAWKNEGGTFTHNSGKVKFDLENSAGSSNVKENEFYDVEVDMFASTYSLSFFDTSGNAVTILNNLDLTKGEINFSTASDTITIHGLTKIAADGTFSDNAAHDTNKIIHNGLVTNSGTYKINDGTTVKMNGGIRNLGTITVA